MNKLILGLPKGSLQEATFAMMQKAGFKVSVGSRSYVPSIDDPTLAARLIRAQEISRYVELGLLDAGITGYDWIVENQSDVVEVADLIYAKQGLRPVRWVLAVPNDSPVQSVKDLNGKRIATEAGGLTRRFLKERGVEAEVEFSWGATEVKAPELVDAIVELTETGSSLRANNLRIVETVLESTTKFIANRKAWKDEWKRRKIDRHAAQRRAHRGVARAAQDERRHVRRREDHEDPACPSRPDRQHAQRPGMGGHRVGSRGERGEGDHSGVETRRSRRHNRNLSE